MREPRDRNWGANHCCAIVGKKARHQIPLVQTCQSRGTIVIDGNKFCKTHLNKMMRGPIEIVSVVGETK